MHHTKWGFFKGYNPFAIPLTGDWIVAPYDNNRFILTGSVSQRKILLWGLFSGRSITSCNKGNIALSDMGKMRRENFRNPEQTLFQWFAVVSDEETVIYTNFHNYDPNHEFVEISVRRSCFYPEKTGLNYITVRGFGNGTGSLPMELHLQLTSPVWLAVTGQRDGL